MQVLVLICGVLMEWMIAAHGGFDFLFVTGDQIEIEPIGRLGPVSFTRYRASTPGLSTWWSSTALRETWF